MRVVRQPHYLNLDHLHHPERHLCLISAPPTPRTPRSVQTLTSGVQSEGAGAEHRNQMLRPFPPSPDSEWGPSPFPGMPRFLEQAPSSPPTQQQSPRRLPAPSRGLIGNQPRPWQDPQNSPSPLNSERALSFFLPRFLEGKVGPGQVWDILRKIPESSRTHPYHRSNMPMYCSRTFQNRLGPG